MDYRYSEINNTCKQHKYLQPKTPATQRFISPSRPSTFSKNKQSDKKDRNANPY